MDVSGSKNRPRDIPRLRLLRDNARPGSGIGEVTARSAAGRLRFTSGRECSPRYAIGPRASQLSDRRFRQRRSVLVGAARRKTNARASAASIVTIVTAVLSQPIVGFASGVERVFGTE